MHNFQNSRRDPRNAGHLSFPQITRLLNGSQHSNLMIPSFHLPDRVRWTNWSRRQTWPWLWGPIHGGTSSWRPSLSVQVRGPQVGTGLAGRSRQDWKGKTTQFLCPVFPALVLGVCLFYWVTLEKNQGVTKRAWLSLLSNPGATVWTGTSNSLCAFISSSKKGTVATSLSKASRKVPNMNSI